MAFNPLQNYMQGQQAGQGQQIQRLSGALAGEMQGGGNIQQSQNFQDLMALDPDRANKSMSTFQALSKERKTALYEDMVMARTLLSRGDAGGALNIFEDRIDALGGPSEGTQDSQYYIDSIRSGNLEKTMADLGSGIEGANAIGIGKAAGKGKKFANVVSPVQTDEETGQQYVAITDPSTQQTKRVDIAGGKGLTQDAKDQKSVRKSLITNAIKISDEAFGDLRAVRTGLGAYQDAIDAIDEGASSGRVQSFFPSFAESTLKLENAGARLGLNVIQATTFGALSEGELRLAMDTAKPPLEPVALRKWLVEKRDAQKKLGRELRKMSIALGRGNMTATEYMEKTGYAEAEMSLDKLSDEDLFN